MSWTVKDQAEPRAVEIVESILGAKLPYPFLGLDSAFWEKLQAKRELLEEFVALCVLDFPTYAAFLHWVVPKGSVARPFLFNNPQRMVWEQMCRLVAQGRSLFMLILKARQVGISTLFAAWICWRVWKTNDLKATIIAHEEPLTHHIMDMMRVAYEHYPEIVGIKPRLRKGNKAATVPKSELFYADRRSGVHLRVAKNLSPRGLDAPIIWESEKAFFPDAQKLDAALLPQLPSLGTPERAESTFISESTPYGQNFFYDEYQSCEPCYAAQERWEDFENGELQNETISIFIPWMCHYEKEFGGYALALPADFELSPEEVAEGERLSNIRKLYDGQPVTNEQMYWRRLTLQRKPYFGDQEFFNREFPSDDVSCFLTFSENAFSEVMPYLRDCVLDAPKRAAEAWLSRKVETDVPIRGNMEFTLPQHNGIETAGRLENIRFTQGNGPLLVWEPPQEGERYVAFLDPSNGIPGGNDAVIQVLTVRCARQVAEWAHNTNPMRAVDMLCAIGNWYNGAMINAEINIHGWTIIQRADERKYPMKARWPKFDETVLSKKWFWETTSRSRNMMFNNLLYAFQEKLVAISSKHLLQELTTFKKLLEMETDDPSASGYLKAVFRQQKHMPDDRTMSFAGAIMTLKQNPTRWVDDFVPFTIPPDAQAAGLQGSQRKNQLGISLEQAAQNDEQAAQMLEKLTGERLAYPSWNPIRGPELPV